jgi:hypothetical protein
VGERGLTSGAFFLFFSRAFELAHFFLTPHKKLSLQLLVLDCVRAYDKNLPSNTSTLERLPTFHRLKNVSTESVRLRLGHGASLCSRGILRLRFEGVARMSILNVFFVLKWVFFHNRVFNFFWPESKIARSPYVFRQNAITS